MSKKEKLLGLIIIEINKYIKYYEEAKETSLKEYYKERLDLLSDLLVFISENYKG